MEQRQVNVVVNVETKNAKTNLKGVEKGLKDTQQQAVKTSDVINDQFSRMGGPLGGLINQVKSLGTSFKGIAVGVGVGAIAGISSLFVSATKKGAEFAQALSTLEAISGATDSEINQLANSAKELGATTQFTSKQVVGLQTEFAKLGFTTKEILNATKSTLDLAASLDIGLGEAASIAGSTLRAFGLQTSETQRVVDVMASSTSSTALDFDALRESLKLVAPTSRAMNVSIEETTAMLGVLADNGLKGSIAGTGLSKTFIELNKKGIPLNEALKQVANSSDALNTAIDLVGVVGSKSLLTLANNAPKIDTLTESFNNSAGAAKELAETRLDNLAGDTTKLSSAWEGFLLSIEDGKGIFNTIARGIVQATTALLNFITPTEKLSESLEKQRTELFRVQVQLNDVNTSQQDRVKIITELQKQYPDYLENIDAETASNEDLNKAIEKINESLINKILIQQKEEEIQEQAAEAADVLAEKIDEQTNLRLRQADIIQKLQDKGIKVQAKNAEELVKEIDKIIEEQNKLRLEGNEIVFDNFNDLRDEQTRLKTSIKEIAKLEAEYNEEQAKTSELIATKEQILKDLNITTEKATESTEDGNDASGEEVEVLTDLIELRKKELEQAEKMPGTTEREIAARNDRINAINEEIKRLKELTLLKDKEERRAQEAIPRMQTRGVQTIQTQNQVTANLEKQTAKRIRNLDAEYEAEEQMQNLKFQAVFTTLESISKFTDAFAGESEQAQKKAFRINKAVGIAQTLVQTFQSAQGAYLSQLSIPTPDAPIRAGIAAGIATATGLANVASIAAQKFQAPSKTTSPAPSVKGFPTSSVSHFDKVSTFFLINSEILLITLDLSQGDVFLQISNPFSADLRALCISLLLAFDALPIISSVAGLITS